MKSVTTFVVMFICAFCIFALFDKMNNVKVEATSDANSSKVVTTDGFGNKQTCETTIVGSNAYTHCN